jgi:hypothetical protein
MLPNEYRVESSKVFGARNTVLSEHESCLEFGGGSIAGLR